MTREDLIAPEYMKAAEVKGLKPSDAIALGLVLLDALVLDAEIVPLLTGGRKTLAELYERGLRESPSGEVVHPSGRDPRIDDAIRAQIEAKYPTPTQHVRNELTINGCVVWYDPEVIEWRVQTPESGEKRCASAAGAASVCDASAAADTYFARIAALEKEPFLVVPLE